MKNNLRQQPQNLFHTYTVCALLLLLANLPLRAQTQSNCLTYSAPGLYTYTVPAGGPFLIRATVRGADGGAKGGSGAAVVSSFAVQSGDQLTIMVGQVGQANYSGQASQMRDLSGGGGGSAVILNHNQTLSLLLAAGAGGGSSLNWDIPGGGGQGIGLASGGAGGSVYQGSSSAYSAGGGGGGLDAPGSGGGSGAFVKPGSGGGQASLTTLSPGGEYGGGSGFGGGGGCSLSYRGGPGGGGGYGGGRGGNGGDPIGGLDGYEIPGPAQGGYSFISPVGSTTAITPGTDGGSQLRDGLVSLDFPNNTATASITSANTAICAGQSTTLTGSVTATGTWTLVLSDGTTTPGSGSSFAITVTPPVSTTYTIQCLTDANGVAQAANLTGSQEVTVNPNPTPTLSNNGPLTCFDPTVTLTATLAEPDPGSTFWFSTTTTLSTSPTSPVSESGIYSVTVVSTGRCSGVASTTVTSIKTTPSAPTLIANAITPVFQNTPGVSLTISGCSTGNLTWTGPGGVTGTSTTVVSVPTSATGTLVYSATCTLGSCTSTASTTLTISPSLVSGSFDGFVNGADCSTFRGWAWDRNKGNTPVSVDILDGPNVIASFLADVFRQDLLDAGKGNGKHSFRFPIPESIKDGLAHNLSARVSGSSFILKDSPKALICQGSSTPGNKAPVPPSPTVLIAPLAAQVGVPFSGTLVPFTDPENQPLSYALTGLPNGLVISMTSRVISGTPTQSGTFVLTYSATDGVLTNSVSFPLTVNPQSTTTVTGDFEGYLDKLDCGGIRGWVWDRKKPNTPLTVEFYRDGTGEVLGSTVANIYRDDLKNAGKGNGAHAYNFTPPGSVTSGTLIRARVLGSTYELKGSPKSYQCAPARLSAEAGSDLWVTVLCNPVSDQVDVEIRGSEGQPLQLQLIDASGRQVSHRHIEVAKPVEQQRFSVQGQSAGLFLLRVSTPSQSRTLKVLKQ